MDEQRFNYVVIRRNGLDVKARGSIFLRDFSPNFGFAYENHHWPGEQIYNFKQPGGHRQFS